MSEWEGEYRPAVLDLTPAQKIAALIVTTAREHGWAGGTFEAFLAWLEDRLALADQVRLTQAEESKLAAHRDFEENPDRRPPGRFARKMRETQAKSASMAMVLMADDLQRAYGEIARLKQYAKDLENQIRELPTWGKEP